MHGSHLRHTDTTSSASSLPGAPEPELKIQPVLLDKTSTTAAAAAADPNPQLQAHLKGRRLIRGRSGGRRRGCREEAVDDRVGGGAVRRREVEVGKRRSSAVLVVRGHQAGARKGRRRTVRCRGRRAALPEPGPVPPVHVHVAAQRLRRPELPPAVAAGVAGRRRQRPRGAAGGQAEVVARRRRRPRLQRLEAAAVVSTTLHCGWPAVWCGLVGRQLDSSICV